MGRKSLRAGQGNQTRIRLMILGHRLKQKTTLETHACQKLKQHSSKMRSRDSSF